MIFVLFILGLAVGSFLNVVIDRMSLGKSIILPPSSCDYCHKKLAWHDLVPVLSFILLGGKCRFCHKKISLQYPFIELITGILFVFTYIYLFNYPLLTTNYQLLQFFYYLIIICGLLSIFFIDLKKRIIPDRILVFLGTSSLLFLYFCDRSNLINHLFAGTIFFLFFLFLVIITRGKGMGLGDVKFAFIIGLTLGFPYVIVAFYLSFLTGAAISLILVLRGKKTMKSTIPFGPFLAVSTVLTLFYGNELWIFLQRLIGI